MKTFLRNICLLVAVLPVGSVYAASGAGVVHLVKPVVPMAAVAGIGDENSPSKCPDGLIPQNEGQCCPPGTTNRLFPWVCTPSAVTEQQLFNGPKGAQYCPSAEMFIVGNKKDEWFSCASSDSKVLYPDAKKPEGGKFCRDHGYGYLIKIKPWGTVGCVKVGDSQGDGCIEAGTCSFKK